MCDKKISECYLDDYKILVGTCYKYYMPFLYEKSIMDLFFASIKTRMYDLVTI